MPCHQIIDIQNGCVCIIKLKHIYKFTYLGAMCRHHIDPKLDDLMLNLINQLKLLSKNVFKCHMSPNNWHPK
jgi:hypothetical protein